MPSSIADVANMALDALGIPNVIGDIEEGTCEAQVLLRHYGPTRRRLLKMAHWNFSRKQVSLFLLGDATGNTQAMATQAGQVTTVGTAVQQPWVYCYALPADCLKARYVPWNTGQIPPIPPDNIQINPTPVTVINGLPPAQQFLLRPARFLVATDSNYPVPIGTDPAYGLAPNARTVVLTNVQSAQLIYTSDVLYPSLWDSQFLVAFTAVLAAECSMALVPDKKMAMALRNQQLAIAKEKVNEARVSDGNEGWPSINREASWIAARGIGAGIPGLPWYGQFGGDIGPGVYGYGWDNWGGMSDGAF